MSFSSLIRLSSKCFDCDKCFKLKAGGGAIHLNNGVLYISMGKRNTPNSNHTPLIKPNTLNQTKALEVTPEDGCDSDARIERKQKKKGKKQIVEGECSGWLRGSS